MPRDLTLVVNTELTKEKKKEIRGCFPLAVVPTLPLVSFFPQENYNERFRTLPPGEQLPRG